MLRSSTPTSTAGASTAGCPNVALTIFQVGHREVRRKIFGVASHPPSPWSSNPSLTQASRFLLFLCTGSSADNIVGHFAVTYANEAEALGVNLEELYAAMVADAEINPPEWNTMGRQVNVYK